MTNNINYSTNIKKAANNVIDDEHKREIINALKLITAGKRKLEEIIKDK